MVVFKVVDASGSCTNQRQRAGRISPVDVVGQGHCFGYSADYSKNSDKQARLEFRKFIHSLADAGCISDPEPLLKKVKVNPRTPECLSAASAAEVLWAPDSRKIKNLDRKTGKKFIRPISRRIKKLDRRIFRLKKKGGKAHKVDGLFRKEFALYEKLGRL
ncbi:MAG: hypothetical protein IPK93_07535 [Solirubrobacterales bacterium]|nr:hypothetical protein [Solirubrobacterales bacterium]